jgi:uncharacterized protein YgbK (DUF1537 family)
MTAPALRLIADDLTGALDTAAEFGALCGPVPVSWSDGSVAGSQAIATATREAARADAVAKVARVAPLLAGADIAFKKIDSLLRGHPAAELGACLAAGRWRSVVLAPAFPAQGRITRDGRQYVRQGEGWQGVAPPLVALLAAEGLAAQAGVPAAPLPAGIVVFDAETETDLRRIVACGRAAPGPVLWCGSGGLGRALAEGAPVRAETRLHGPVLGLFGSDQATTRRQLAACGALWNALRDPPDSAPRIADQLAIRGAALVTLDLPPALSRAEAAHRIAAGFAALVAALPRPGTLLVAGGETLGAICTALGAEALLTHGLVAPGVPRATMRGGRWDGLEVISKSGAFGGDTLWRDLLQANGFIQDMHAA